MATRALAAFILADVLSANIFASNISSPNVLGMAIPSPARRSAVFLFGIALSVSFEMMVGLLKLACSEFSADQYGISLVNQSPVFIKGRTRGVQQGHYGKKR